jgi:hypothetical protein
VRQAQLPQFAEQRVQYQLRFTCEHCTYFEVNAERCTHGYPNHEHRAARYERADTRDLIFCKEFELK